MRVVLVCLVAAVGCDGPEDLKFGKAFMFGSAIAGFQTEMGCPTVPAAECEDRSSDWYTWITDPTLKSDSTLFIKGDPPSAGPGFYELYEADLDRAAHELHHNAFRLSIEWSRVFPAATDGIDGFAALKTAASAKALAFYHALFAALKARGLRPFVTLNHYTLPTWIHDAAGCHADLDKCTHKGWVDHDRMLKEIAKYAGFVAQEFGGEVDLWATENEPLTALVLAGYLDPTADRSNPPGTFLRADAAKVVYHTLIEAHARMYDAVKAGDTVDTDGDGKPARVGIVYNLQAARPDSTDPLDAKAVKNLLYVMNQVFLDGVGLGLFDENLDGNQVARDDLAHRLDFLGVNYYRRVVVQGTETSFLPQVSPLLTFNLLALNYDYDYSKGILDVFRFAKRYNVPLVISETGVEDHQDTGLASRWLVETLTWVKRAMRENIPVEGYFYWTLTDNYEWNHGMDIKMGLYALDLATKARTARNAVATFGRIAAAAEIPADLAAKYPAH
jgi:beta-glucosidase/6-phospho-beta-glucosidase/beta-galactosidase